MLRHGYLERDFEVGNAAAPEFLEQAAREPIAERWKIATTEKLPTPSELQASSRRLG